MTEWYDYRTVDIPVHNGRLSIDVTVNQMAQEGWRPVALIPPVDQYPHNSIVFEKEVIVYE